MRRLLVVALALAFVPPASGAKLPNACRLLTNAEVSKALGARIAYRNAKTTRVLATCTWNGPPLNRYTSTGRSLTVWLARTAEPKFVHAWKSRGDRVRGIGKVAFRTYGQVTELAVWKHGYFVVFNVDFVTSPLRVEKALAKRAVEHL